jgi:hypothetical protein
VRKNCSDTLKAWRAGKSLGDSSKSIWTDGQNIYSYGTCLVTRLNESLLLNRTKYSITTTIHQNALAAAIPPHLEMDDIPRGASAARIHEMFLTQTGLRGIYERS